MSAYFGKKVVVTRFATEKKEVIIHVRPRGRGILINRKRIVDVPINGYIEYGDTIVCHPEFYERLIEVARLVEVVI